jgi:hypothetical protein
MESSETFFPHQDSQPKGSRRKNKEVTKHVAFKEEVKKDKLKNTKLKREPSLQV